MYETDLAQCKTCNQIKVKKFIGKYDANNKKYVDEHGKAWNGRKCPQCQVDHTKHRMRELRADRKDAQQAKI